MSPMRVTDSNKGSRQSTHTQKKLYMYNISIFFFFCLAHMRPSRTEAVTHRCNGITQALQVVNVNVVLGKQRALVYFFFSVQCVNSLIICTHNQEHLISWTFGCCLAHEQNKCHGIEKKNYFGYLKEKKIYSYLFCNKFM
ncbi:hypothetical protein AB205_0092680 [Aquarana catesbeiana]|uniref:Uncharacterized protein n=1 Tax=Aquarana catesbeiana TaxID=8400 RepID=A0A2G9RW30_AQUCT|nr:hypothetical protein AB205_0092680 [Aquarana catesbeiana]